MPAAQAHRYDEYSLVAKETIGAAEYRLYDATWYRSPVPKEALRELLRRRDWPAIRDTTIWFALIIGSGWLGYLGWQAGSWWAIVPFMIYGLLYASTSDSRWHESSHGTAFATDWLNNALYEIASFMVLREATVWRWSHTRHHSDTLIVGRDPEIAVKRPPALFRLILDNVFKVDVIAQYVTHLLLHCTGRMADEERVFVPPSEFPKVFVRAWIYLLVYTGVFGLAIYQHSLLPLMYVGLPTLYGSWLMMVYSSTQHAGLAENVLDHRLNSRTVYMNPINRFLYWNMNYHIEHHMFPLVPYHHLPKLHELVKADMPAPYPSLWNAWHEIVPAVLRQAKDPGYCVNRPLPAPTRGADTGTHAPIFTAKALSSNGWLEKCASDSLGPEDVIRVDHERRTYAIYRALEGRLYATDGRCTHGGAHLADGRVKGNLIECYKHNGRFDITDGSAKRMPACVALKTHEVRELDGKILLRPASAIGR